MDLNHGKVCILHRVAEALLSKDERLASKIIMQEYPFKRVGSVQRNCTDFQKIAVYSRDNFTDRYSGEKLVNPGLLRVISQYLPTIFPFHSHWKFSECHTAYWELFPTVDHVVPVALGGADNESNWVTTTMLNNSIKANWTLAQLRWTLRPIASEEKWDGLTGVFVRLVQAAPHLLDNSYIERWYRVSTKYGHPWSDC